MLLFGRRRVLHRRFLRGRRAVLQRVVLPPTFRPPSISLSLSLTLSLSYLLLKLLLGRRRVLQRRFLCGHGEQLQKSLRDNLVEILKS